MRRGITWKSSETAVQMSELLWLELEIKNPKTNSLWNHFLMYPR